MEKNTRIIGVISGKGGVGKTTVVANLGATLAKKFKKDVVIVDCNITTSHLSISLGMYYCPITLNAVLRDGKNISEAMYDHPSGMKVVPASIHLREIVGVDIAKLRDCIKELSGKVGIVILDSSPGLGRETYATIHASEEILFVTNPNIVATSDIIRCGEIIKEVGKKPIGIVLNMVKKKGYELSKREVEILTTLPVVATIPFDMNVQKSLAAKKPLVLFKPNSPASKAIEKLARHIIGEEEKKGFIQKLLEALKI
jgi:septum site-determining protein MinD